MCLASTEGMIANAESGSPEPPAADGLQPSSPVWGESGDGWPSTGPGRRGLVDRVLGGVGFRRGRRDPVDLRVGDALDFWRVESVEPGRMLRLRAEMKVPGLAWLGFEAERD